MHPRNGLRNGYSNMGCNIDKLRDYQETASCATNLDIQIRLHFIRRGQRWSHKTMAVQRI